MVNKIIALFSELSCIFCPPKMLVHLNHLYNKLYTERMKKVFASVGDNAYIMSNIYVRGGQKIIIGNNFYCYWGVRIETYSCHNGMKFNPQIIIGNNVSINPDCHIGAITFVGSGIVIYSIFYISVAENIRSYGQLRTIGTTKKQIKKIVYLEGKKLAGIGIPLGLIAGNLIGYFIIPNGWNWLTSLIMTVVVGIFAFFITMFSIRTPVKRALRDFAAAGRSCPSNCKAALSTRRGCAVNA